MYKYDNASVSSNSETLSLYDADGEIGMKDVENAIQGMKCGKAEKWSYYLGLVLVFVQFMLEVREDPRRLARRSHRAFV